jgi:hypothetical protein
MENTDGYEPSERGSSPRSPTMSKKNDYLLEAVKQGYKIDTLGRVISPNGNILCPYNDNGYYTFSIRLNGAKGYVKVHRLAGYLKFGDIVLDKEVRHLDNNSKNNSWNNIEIGTRQDNELDKPKNYRVKTAKYAASFVRKMSRDESIKLREDRNDGMSYSELRTKYGLAKSTLWYIINNNDYGMLP